MKLLCGVCVCRVCVGGHVHSLMVFKTLMGRIFANKNVILTFHSFLDMFYKFKVNFHESDVRSSACCLLSVHVNLHHQWQHAREERWRLEQQLAHICLQTFSWWSKCQPDSFCCSWWFKQAQSLMMGVGDEHFMQKWRWQCMYVCMMCLFRNCYFLKSDAL